MRGAMNPKMMLAAALFPVVLGGCDRGGTATDEAVAAAPAANTVDTGGAFEEAGNNATSAEAAGVAEAVEAVPTSPTSAPVQMVQASEAAVQLADDPAHGEYLEKVAYFARTELFPALDACRLSTSYSAAVYTVTLRSGEGDTHVLAAVSNERELDTSALEACVSAAAVGFTLPEYSNPTIPAEVKPSVAEIRPLADGQYEIEFSNPNAR